MYIVNEEKCNMNKVFIRTKQEQFMEIVSMQKKKINKIYNRLISKEI